MATNAKGTASIGGRGIVFGAWQRCAALGITLSLALVGCVSKPIDVDPALLEERFKARAAIRYGEEGGSGQLFGMRTTDGYRFEFFGALGQGHWRLTQNSRGAEFVAADGVVERAASAELLMQRRLGWHVPVRAFWSWATGRPVADEAVANRRLDDNGRLLGFEQAGFDVSFDDWVEVEPGLWRPQRIVIRRASLSVRIKVSQWQT